MKIKHKILCFGLLVYLHSPLEELEAALLCICCPYRPDKHMVRTVPYYPSASLEDLRVLTQRHVVIDSTTDPDSPISQGTDAGSPQQRISLTISSFDSFFTMRRLSIHENRDLPPNMLRAYMVIQAFYNALPPHEKNILDQIE